MADARIRVLMRIWLEEGKIEYELLDTDVFCEPELIINLPSNRMPIKDFYEETISDLDLHKIFLPEKFEVCEEPIIYEVIGTLTIEGHIDYWGEYDQEHYFDLEKWTCEIESETYSSILRSYINTNSIEYKEEDDGNY